MKIQYFIGFAILLLAACQNKLMLTADQPTTVISTSKMKPDVSKEFETISKVEELMSKMTLEEKIGQLNLLTPGGAVTGAVVSKDVEKKIKNGQVGGIFGIWGAGKLKQAQKMAVENSRLGIPLLVGQDVIHGHQTLFPIPLALSCSWDMQLIENSAKQAAREATADGIMWTFSPMVDIARDPRWGRISEGAGEDPFLGGKVGAAFIKGYQGDDLKDPMTMLACVKHFANYGAAEGGRDYAAADMSRVRMFNEYFPPYKAAVDAGVATVMTSFNVVDYVPASANKYLFDEILRKKWGFEGMVVSDYTSINEMIAHGIGDLQEVSQRALNAGVDMDMVGEGFLTTLQKSLEEGKVTLAQIDDACRRILVAKEKLGLFEDPYRYCDEERAKKDILSDELRSFGRAAAAETFVLLKNENDILPLQKNAKIALVGPLVDGRANMHGSWAVSGDWKKATTVKEAFEKILGNTATIKYAKGANISDDPVMAKRVNTWQPEIEIDERNPDVMIAEAVKAANESEVIIAVMGEAANMTGEASSMADISLQDNQQKLLMALKETGKPIVLVLFNGRPMVLNWEEENMDAILDVWFSGTEGANAIVDVLFGDVNPSGKLTTSFPVHVGQIPVYHSMHNSGRPYNGEDFYKFKSNYLDIPNEPLYPFGYGLSYTNFSYSKPALDASTLNANGKLKVSVTVTNKGAVKGKEVVQLYIRDLVGSITRPLKELKGFEKIELMPGASKTVSFEINPELLKFYNYDLDHVVEPGEFKVFIGPNSRDVQELAFEYR